MHSVVGRSQVSLGAVASEKLTIDLDKNSGKLHFFLSGYLQCLVANTAVAERFPESLILLAVFQEVLRRYTGQKSVGIRFNENGAVSSIRAREEELSFREALEQLQSRDTGLPNVTLDGEFSFQHAGNSALVQSSENAGGIHLAIECGMQESPEKLSGVLQFDRKIWDSAVMPYLVSSYQNLLAEALNSPDVKLAELDILDTADRQKFDTWNANGRYYPHARVDELFELRVLERPDDTALSFLDKSLSYRALSDQAKSFALRLQKLGVQPGTLVGIYMDRSPEMIVALLATFKNGAAYLPLDPSFPEDRIAFMQQDARPLVIVTQAHLREKLSFSTAHVIAIDANEPMDAERSLGEGTPSRDSSLDDVAYVLYTSGSTGKPKGVQITHRALTNMLTVVSDDVKFDCSDVVLGTTTISFDISTFEIFAPLIAGAHLVVAERAVAANGELFARAIRETGATVLQATPAGWQVLLEAGWKSHRGLKMLTAGEPLSWMLAQRLLAGGGSLWNLYGPTEVTVYATGRQIYPDTQKITVGPTLANYTAYVLDGHRRQLPIGAIGELFLGGIGVGAGYLNRPELTAEKFFPDPFAGDVAARLYRTGDLARMLPNGEIDLIGRADNQIKLRGYRIELEEVEALLDSHPGISKSVARVVDIGDGEQSLVAYVVPRDLNVTQEAAWRAHALRSLPAYMVPTAFMVMDSFALTPNGKVDRKALPSFQMATPPGMEIGSELPGNGLEQTVLRCWRRVLGRPTLDVDHNFFDAGGHSLLVMRMFAEMNNTIGYKLPVCLIVEAPTARTFSERALQIRHAPASCLVSMQLEGVLPPIYLVHHLLGDVLIYRSLANQFAPNRPVYGIQPPPDLIERSQPYSLRALASEYVGEILKQHTAGPIHLAGFSSGSVFAFEMASQLKERGMQVGLLALIDGDVPAPGPRMPAAARYAKVVRRKLCKIAFKLKDEVAVGPRQFVAIRVRHIWLQLRIRILEKSTAQGSVTTEQALLLAERAYEGKPYDGSALLMRFHDEAWSFGPDPMMGWSSLVQREIEVVDLPGGHITGMGPVGAPVMAALLRSHMEALEPRARQRI